MTRENEYQPDEERERKEYQPYEEREKEYQPDEERERKEYQPDEKRKGISAGWRERKRNTSLMKREKECQRKEIYISSHIIQPACLVEISLKF